MKKIIFSNHAKKRCFERDINEETIRYAIEKPDYTINRFENEIEAFKKMNGKTIKVVYIEKENFIKVITLHWA